MKIKGICLSITLALVSMMSAQSSNGSSSLEVRPIPTHEMASLSTYFLMIDRFDNGDPGNDGGTFGVSRLRGGYDPADISFFHGGDFKGITRRLDYIKGLGFNAIWVTPPVKNISGGFGAASYHGYAGVDFTTVDSRFGSVEDFRDLIDTAHEKGLKVLIDVVVNHTADVIQPKDGDSSYVEVLKRPYRRFDGAPFRVTKSMALGKEKFPKLSVKNSFPKVPVSSPAAENVKNPVFLRDLTNYHNRGDSTFQGESVEYGDFYGLDDLFTEKPEVVRGWIKTWSKWIKDFDIDGMRIDTYKHVNNEFWLQFIPAIQKVARNSGKEDFPIFGEVYDADPASLAAYIREVSAPSLLDFAFQNRVERFVSNGVGAIELAQLFNDDDFYTTPNFTATSLATFLGNHDMGRIGLFIKKKNPYATREQLFERSKLAMAMLFLLRGSPVGYYGDEKGLMGDPGDKGARQDLFSTQVVRWQGEERIGMAPIGTASSFELTNPLETEISSLQSFAQSIEGFRSSSQRTRFAEQGTFVVTRETKGRVFWLIFNSSDQTSTFNVDLGDSSGIKFELGDGEYGNQRISVAPRNYLVISHASSAKTPKISGLELFEFDSGFGPLETREFGVTFTHKDQILVSFYLRKNRSQEWKYLGSSQRPTFQTNRDRGNTYRIFISRKALTTKSELIAVSSDSDGDLVKSNLLAVGKGS